MNLPIFITGYERSGTTLLRRLVSMHPSLEYDIVHEKPHLLMRANSTDEAFASMTYGASSIRSGQKIPYVNFTIAKKYIDKFYYLFPHACLMHIIRDPLMAINSQAKTGRKAQKCIPRYFASVPATYKYAKTMPQNCVVCYEDLITKPREVLANIYKWMGEEVDPDYLEKVITTKESWEYNGRTMPGLRYFDKIIPLKRDLIIKQNIINQIRAKPKLEYKGDF